MALQRKVLTKMKQWKDSIGRKPLVLDGARQVGKTWLMEEFGRQYFTDVLYINFDKQPQFKIFFADTKQPEIIIERLSLARGKKIESDKTLIIFDEIQECPNALNALKYFNEDAPEYFVVSAGSLLGVYLAKKSAQPVGQVNIINVYPMDFEEFLQAVNYRLFEIYNNFLNDPTLIEAYHVELLDEYKKYLLIGGLPEAVQAWVSTQNYELVETIHKELVTIYERDFSKHHGDVEPERILMVFRNIPTQLAKENSRFIYGNIQKGARARNFETAIEWLQTAAMINRVYKVTKNEAPLKSFNDVGAFKIYMFDTGLLKHLAEVPNEMILFDDAFQFKGYLAENFVLQQLKTTISNDPKYFVFNKRYEIDFLIQDARGNVIPIEVKSSDNVASVSFNTYNKLFNPNIRIRFSTLGYKIDDNLINIPFYLIGKTNFLIKQISALTEVHNARN